MCQLLDERHSASYHLEYSLADLRQGLADVGDDCHITIDTEKQLGLEASTGLDLGITFTEHLLGASAHTRAVLSALSTVKSVSQNGIPRLDAFYKTPPTDYSFPTFADFMTQLVEKEVGSESSDIIALASGRSRRGLTGAKFRAKILVSEESVN